MTQGFALGQQSTWLNQANNGGRLTLTSGLPVTTSDVTGATSVYFTPYVSNYISLYDGSSLWVTLPFSEITISVPATTSTMYDVFAYNNSGVVACETLAWTNDTTRATALVLQNGIYVKSGATTRRYIGSFRTTTVSGQTEDSVAKRYVWNYNNRVLRQGYAIDTTNSWSYSTNTFRQANAATTNQLDYVIGVSEETFFAEVKHHYLSSGATARTGTCGIGLSSTTVNSAITYDTTSVTSTTASMPRASYVGLLPAGRNYIVWLERGDGTDTQTWTGDGGATNIQTGIFGFTSM